jgi:hypothetical protein
MKHLALFVLLASSTSSDATSVDQIVIPADMDQAGIVMDEVHPKLTGKDHYYFTGFIIRSLWCEGVGRPIHAGLTVRQAIELVKSLEAADPDLDAKVDKNNSADVDRVCGPEKRE